jgi:predicted ATPase/DNA-binding CsgD family transcriptional regulator
MARPSRRLGNLPAEATSFVGRRRELAELRTRLSGARLVSLVGPGGVGKTRLAIRIASDLGRAFPDGAWLVELADVRDPSLVSNALVAALDLRDQAATEPLALLLAYLRDKQLLLVVDNCEHLLSATAQLVNQVIKAAPGVRVIATSREPLTASGEQVVPVTPLELPPARSAYPLEQARQNEAIALFTDRATGASGKFDLTASNQAAVADVCRRLDGLPLAIELAAVRTRALTVEQILERLTDRFGLLTGGGRAALPRHQTLRTTIDWSHDLLAPGEQTLLRRLCVFAGRFTLEDVESICVSDDIEIAEVLDLISSLVDKSLVIKEEVRGRACYRLHETMREYAILKLRDADEVEVLGESLISYYWSTCLEQLPQSRYRLVEWLDSVELEIDNVRAILGHCLARRDPRGVDLVVGHCWFWITRATNEGARWLDWLLAAVDGNPQTLAWAYFMRGFMAVLQSDPGAALPALERAMAVAREQDQVMPLSQSLSMSSIAKNVAGDPASAARMLAESERVTIPLHEHETTLGLLQARVFDGFFKGDLDAVRSAATEGVRMSREAGDLYPLEMMTMNLAFAALMGGELEVSKPIFENALRIARQLDDRVAEYALLDAIACIAAATKQPRLAAKLLGAAETVRIGAGASMVGWVAPLVAVAEEAARAGLGPARFEAEFDAGKRMSRDAAIALALGEQQQLSVVVAEVGHHAPGPLGKREADVARLVADGLSNRQIGARLFISERTVDGHVRNILNKLGFNSRAQIAAWMAAAGH